VAKGALSASAIEQYRRDTRLQSASLDDRFAVDLELLGQIAVGFSHDPHWLEKMAFGYERIGDLLAKKGNLPLALLAHERALAILEHLGTLNQQDAQFVVVLYSNNMSIGDILRDMGNPADALPPYRRALALAQQASQMQPGNIMAQAAEAQAWNRVGYALMLDGEDLHQAEEALRMAVQLGRAASLRDPTNMRLREHLANSLVGLARVSFARGHAMEVREPLVEAVELAAALLTQNAGMVRWKGELREAMTLARNTADRLIAMGSLEDAEMLLTRVMATTEGLRPQQPFTADLPQQWFDLLQRLVTVYVKQLRGQRAVELLSPELEALDHLSVRTDLPPGDMTLVQSRLGTLALMAAAANAHEGRFEVAFTWMRRAWLTRSPGLLPVLDIFPEPFQRMRDDNPSRFDLLVRRMREITVSE
jgi:tetratricopeptide (TPR) repeat protein